MTPEINLGAIAQPGDVIGWGAQGCRGRVDYVIHSASRTSYAVTLVGKDGRDGGQHRISSLDSLVLISARTHPAGQRVEGALPAVTTTNIFKE